MIITTRSQAARANGRFPQAQAIETAPGSDGQTVFLRATFGILVSRDRGGSWRWICERSLGYGGEWDPPIAVTRDGTLWVGLEDGAASTRDGCAVQSYPEIGEPVKDLTVDGKGETLFAITGRPGKPSHVWRKRPSSPRWERLGGKGLEDLNLLSIEVAPSRSSRIYVSGEPYDTVRGRLYRSDDDGATFHGEANDEKAEGPFFIAAVDPRDPSRVLLRHLHGKGSELLVTHDGKTFENVLSMKSAMFGFAKSADGQTYWAASGLARDGIFRSTDRGAHFERVSNHGVLCLHAAGPETLYVCENIWQAGSPFFAVSNDAGKTVTPSGRFDTIEGPIACDAPDAAATMCGPGWPDLQAFLRPSSEAPEDAGAARQDDDRDAGRQLSRPRSSCACDAPGAAPDRGLFSVGLTTLGVWALARVARGSVRARGGRS